MSQGEYFFTLRAGLVHIDDQNKVFVVEPATPFTHMGRLSAPVTWVEQVGNYGVLFQGKPVPMTFTNEIDAGLLLLELKAAPPTVLYPYWMRNNERSTRKVPPESVAAIVLGKRAGQLGTGKRRRRHTIRSAGPQAGGPGIDPLQAIDEEPNNS
jgi:hypothetical protein